MQSFLNNRFLSSLYTLIALVSASWFLPVFNSLLSQTNLQSRLEISVYVGFMLIIQILVIRWIVARYRGWGAHYSLSILAALILTMNVLGLLLSFSDPYLVLHRPLKAGIVLGLMVFFFGMSRVLIRKPVLTGALSLLYAGTIVYQVTGLLTAGEPTKQTVAPGSVKQVNFKTRPNIYLLSFDAMVSPEVAAEFLDLPQPDYVQALEEMGARLFKNTFSDGESTQPSLNTTLYLDPAVWRENLKSSNLAFSGVAPSPVFEIFRNNGYKISSYYAGTYRLQGPYIDEYITREAAQSYCTFALPWFYFQHLGYCRFREKILDRVLPRTGEGPRVFDRQIIDSFIDRATSEQPWLNYIYTYAPGHTDLDYSHSQSELDLYKRRYKASQQQTTDYMRSMLYAISTYDPTGIIYVFGDHGAWLSRAETLHENNAAFIIRDRHSVFSAVYPGDVCEAYLGYRDGESFITPSLIIRQLITCLADGDDPLDRKVDYSGPYPDYGFDRFVFE